AKTPKRNEPCPCGSGKKYKDCCAKSGPKKGLFAK
ncbi:SEC-C metal-binding domain-containing protein, partial [Helicobacter pylori]